MTYFNLCSHWIHTNIEHQEYKEPPLSKGRNNSYQRCLLPISINANILVDISSPGHTHIHLSIWGILAFNDILATTKMHGKWWLDSHLCKAQVTHNNYSLIFLNLSKCTSCSFIFISLWIQCLEYAKCHDIACSSWACSIACHDFDNTSPLDLFAIMPIT